MAIEWVARQLLDWIDLDHNEATDALPGSLGESLPGEVTGADETTRSAASSDKASESSDTATADRTATSDAAAPSPSENGDSGGSRLRRFGPYILGLAAAVAAFGAVLGIVGVVRGWIEELRMGYTPMGEPSDSAEDLPADPDGVSRSPAVETGGERRPAAVAGEGQPPGADEAGGDILAAMAGLAFHAIVDRIVTERSETDGTTIPVETED